MFQRVSASQAFTPPSLDDVFPPSVFFQGTPFAIDRLVMIRLVIAGVLLLVLIGAALRVKLVPGRLQNIVEFIFDFVRINIAEEVLGRRAGNKYVPLLTTIFILILGLNLTSVIPFMNISSNARIAMPLTLAILGYVTFVIVGIRHHGMFGYFRKASSVPGVPFLVLVFFVPIEIFSTFILRPITLSLRLMANMLSGHLIIALIFAATEFFYQLPSAHFMFLGSIFGSLVGVIAGVAMTIFEIFICGLQAYIFVLLIAVHIDQAIYAGEH